MITLAFKSKTSSQGHLGGSSDINQSCKHCKSLLYLICHFTINKHSFHVFTCYNQSCSTPDYTAVRSAITHKQHTITKPTTNTFEFGQESSLSDITDILNNLNITQKKQSQSQVKESTSTQGFKKYPLKFQDYHEPEQEYSHELELLEQYNKTHGLIQDCDTEKYEKCEPSFYQDFTNFQKHLEHEPLQCIRYSPNNPLWYSAYNQQIPKCKCGAERQFVFQLMPNIINILTQDEEIKDIKAYLSRKTLDFITVLIFACQDNCSSDSPNNEYCIVQKD
jgi:hypothetical protein